MEGTDRYESIRLENQMSFSLYACAKEMTRQYRKPLKKLGLTYTQYIVMMAFWEHGGMTESELGEKVHLDSGTLAPLLKRLEKQGLVVRVRPRSNENRLHISLTEAGRALKEEAMSVSCDVEEGIALSREERERLKELLDMALKEMEERR